MHTWADGVGQEEKEAFRRALGELPEQISAIAGLRFGDDLGMHDDNYDFVTVLDYEDLAACRRYVEHPAHQAFVTRFARPLCSRRAVIQHEWDLPAPPAVEPNAILGVHHVKFPVREIGRSRDWYERVFALEVVHEFREDGVVRGVAYRIPGSQVSLALREAPEEALGLEGFDPVAFLVEDRAALVAWGHRLDTLGIQHSPITDGTVGWIIEFKDPDGLNIRLYTREQQHPVPHRPGPLGISP